jgi:hypothetical protein
MGYSKEPTAVALCNARYGREITTKLKLRLIGGTQNKVRQQKFVVWRHIFARFGHDVHGRKVVTPTATKSAFNKHWRSNQDGSRNWRASVAIKAKDLYEHLLAGADEIERMVAYTNACSIVGDHRVGLFMLDIDCHHGQPTSEAWATADVLDYVINAPIYWEPSTSGTGLHGFVTLLWHPTLDRSRIRSDIRELEGIIGEITADMPARCAEVRGAPMLFSADGKMLLKMASWAKLPRPQSRDEAIRLIHTLENGISCFDAINSAHSALSSSRKKTAAQPNSLPSDRSSPVVLVEGQSSNCARPLLIQPKRDKGDDHTKIFYRGQSSFDRAADFVPWIIRKQFRAEGRLPSLKKVLDAYVQEGLDTGNSDERCVTEVYDKMVSTFNPDFVCCRSITAWLPHATEVIEAVLHNQADNADLAEEHMRRKADAKATGQSPSSIKSLRRLRPERLAKLLACMLWVLADIETRSGGFGQKLAVGLMREAFSLSVHQREFDAAMAWFVRVGLCELVSEAIATKNGTGRCRTYRLSNSATQSDVPPL